MKTKICRLHADFIRGRTDTNYTDRSGRPNEVLASTNAKKRSQNLYKNGKAKLCEVVDILKILFSSIYSALWNIQNAYNTSNTTTHR